MERIMRDEIETVVAADRKLARVRLHDRFFQAGPGLVVELFIIAAVWTLDAEPMLNRVS